MCDRNCPVEVLEVGCREYRLPGSRMHLGRYAAEERLRAQTSRNWHVEMQFKDSAAVFLAELAYRCAVGP
jgi:hypothetical protein